MKFEIVEDDIEGALFLIDIVNPTDDDVIVDLPKDLVERVKRMEKEFDEVQEILSELYWKKKLEGKKEWIFLFIS